MSFDKFIGLTAQGKALVEQQNCYVVSARRRAKYIDGQVIDGEFAGTAVTVQIDRGQTEAGMRVDILIPEVWSDEEIEQAIDCDCLVTVDEAKVYATSRKGSTYAEVKMSLHGRIVVGKKYSDLVEAE